MVKMKERTRNTGTYFRVVKYDKRTSKPASEQVEPLFESLSKKDSQDKAAERNDKRTPQERQEIEYRCEPVPFHRTTAGS
jgi:hypothetical protein